MRIDAPIFTGSFSLNGNTLQDLGSVSTTGSNAFVGNQTIQGFVSASALTGSINYTNLTSVPTLVSGGAQVIDIISSINSFTSSNGNTSLNSFSASNGNTSLNQLTGSLATTGSNTFFGTQTFSGSVFIANNLVVQGSSSIQYISASSVSIGTNIVQLNTANPSVRYAGLTMIDSGSVGGSGSFLYDSLQDEFVFVHRGNGTNVTSSHFVLGPETYDSLGNETYLTTNRLPKGTGKEHLVDSCIYESGGCIGINTSNPQSLLDVQNCIDSPYLNTNTLTSGQWLRVSNPSTCQGANSGILFVATGPGGGNGLATINGVTTSCGSMAITFATRDASSNVTEKMRILSVGTVAIGTQTSSPQPHAGGIVGGLIVQGLNSCRGIIEIWDGTCGKGVFQQIGGTTYIGNLDKGTSGGSLRLLVNGSGTSATEAMVITCSGRVLINNSAQNGCADYSRLTISGGYAKTNNCTGFLTSVLHLATCENDFPFGAKFGIYGDSCSTNRYLAIQTGDHNITNQGNIVLQPAGGNVGIGTATACSILDVRGTITNGSTAGSNSTIDVSPAKQSIANGGYVDFPNMSGMIVVNDWTDGSATIFLVGAGVTSTVGSNNGTTGTTHYSVGISGYRWCNNKGYTANFGFLVFKTRNTA